MEFDDVIKRRRSVRRFNDQRPDPAVIVYNSAFKNISDVNVVGFWTTRPNITFAGHQEYVYH